MIKAKEYESRRRNFMNQMGDRSIAIIPSAEEVIRSRDTHFPFRQDSNFLYLTGFNEPNAMAVFIPGRAQGEFIMFCRDRNIEREIWDGYREGPDGARANFGADDAFPIDDLDEILPGLIEGREKVFFRIGQNQDLDRQLNQWLDHIRQQARSGASVPGEIVDPQHILHEMRLIKSSSEIKLMRKVAKISAEAHCKAMIMAKPGAFEYELQAEIEYHFARNGASGAAYSSIVGAGKNACVLHYTANKGKTEDSDLVLIDAGAEYEGYAADITRTFPVNGRYSDDQKAIYELVLRAQLAAIDLCRPGVKFNEPHEACVEILTEGLVDLGLLKGDVEQLIKDRAYMEFYMHRAGHWLGLDVHDVGEYKVDGAESDWREFEPGMVTTIEPGIYIQLDNEKVDVRWRGLGVRIEDDILITRDGPEVLTDGVPKTVAETEALMNHKKMTESSLG